MKQLLLLTAVVALSATAAQAQRRGANAPETGAATPAGPNPNVSVMAIGLPRAEVAQLTQRLAPSFPPPKGTMERMKDASLNGNRARNAAVDTILNHRVQSLGSDGMTSVILVIGSQEDRDKVVESLSQATRKVLVAHLDRDFSDVTADNSVVTSGITPSAQLKGTNMRIYLPRNGAGVGAKPNDVYPVGMASVKFWTGYFGAKGDGITGDQLRAALAADSNAEAAAAQRGAATPVASTDAAAAGATPAVGSIVVSRLSALKLYASPGSQGNVVGTASKADELIVQAVEGAFLKVSGNPGTGWVSASLVARQP